MSWSAQGDVEYGRDVWADVKGGLMQRIDCSVDFFRYMNRS